MLTLFYSRGSCSLAPHIALEEAGIPYRLEKADVLTAPAEPEYRSINPLGRVPALRLASGDVLTETPALLEYIAGLSADAPRLPEDAWGQARAREWMSFFCSSVHIAFIGFFRPARFTDDISAWDALRKDGRSRFLELLRYIEGRLPRAGYTLGPHYSVCDPYAFLFYLWGRHVKLPVAELPRYTELVATVLARPAVQRALAQEGIEFTKISS